MCCNILPNWAFLVLSSLVFFAVLIAAASTTASIASLSSSPAINRSILKLPTTSQAGFHSEYFPPLRKRKLSTSCCRKLMRWFLHGLNSAVVTPSAGSSFAGLTLNEMPSYLSSGVLLYQSLIVRRASVETHRCHHESNWTRTWWRTTSPRPPQSPCTPWWGAGGRWSRGWQQRSCTSGEASGIEDISIRMLQINTEHSWVVLCLFHLFFSILLCFLLLLVSFLWRSFWSTYWFSLKKVFFSWNTTWWTTSCCEYYLIWLLIWLTKLD